MLLINHKYRDGSRLSILQQMTNKLDSLQEKKAFDDKTLDDINKLCEMTKFTVDDLQDEVKESDDNITTHAERAVRYIDMEASVLQQ